MNHNDYMSLPYDLSGSRSKNRFRRELLWGVSKMLDLMEEDRDFTMVFDYVCDVEVHFENGYDFYQIKAHGINTSAYTSKSLTKKASPGAEGSIVGKLYILNNLESKEINLFLVTNTPYSCDRVKIDEEIRCFDSFPDKKIIEDALCEELGITDTNLSNMFYIYTHMNLKDPKYEIQGKIVISFEKIKKCEPQNPIALCRLIFDTVNDKACYEFSAEDYETIIHTKGITRDEFNKFLDCHAVNEKTGIKQTQDYINTIDSISVQRAYRKALTKLLTIMPNNRILMGLENEISTYLIRQKELGNIESVSCMLAEVFHERFPLEYEDADKMVFYFIIIYKFEEGAYDNENDI